MLWCFVGVRVCSGSLCLRRGPREAFFKWESGARAELFAFLFGRLLTVFQGKYVWCGTLQDGRRPRFFRVAVVTFTWMGVVGVWQDDNEFIPPTVVNRRAGTSSVMERCLFPTTRHNVLVVNYRLWQQRWLIVVPVVYYGAVRLPFVEGAVSVGCP